MSSPHPIKPMPVAAAAVASIPRFSTRPVHPFSLSCAFDRQRGQFVLLAGARAGACAVVTAAALAIGTFGYVRTALFGGGPTTASASVTPPLASTTMAATKTITPTKAPSPPQTSPKAKSSAKAVKSTKSAKADAPLLASAPAPAPPTIKHHTPAEPQKADGREAGLDYLVVLTLRTKASAEKAREALLRKGVATTVERSLPGLSDDRKYSLVCLTGFDPDSDKAKLDKQMKRLKALKLDPKPYTWGG